MESVSHASVWGVGYFPRRAVAVTCGIGVRTRVAGCVSMPVPCTAQPMVKGVLGLRRESRRGRRGRVPEEHVHPRVEQLLRRLHAQNAGEPLASKSTRRELPTVPERSKSCQEVSTSADTAASGSEKHPRKFSGICGARQSVTTEASWNTVDCQPRVRHRLRTSTSPNSSWNSSDDSQRPIVLDQRSPSYHHMRCYRPPAPTSRLARSRSPAR